MVSTAWRTTTTTLSSSRLEVAVCIALAVALLTPPIPAVAATAAAYASPRIVPKRTAATKISTPFNHHHHHRHHPIFRPVALSLFSAQNNNYDSPHQRTGRHSPTPRTRTTATTILRATPPKEEEDIALLDDNNNNEGTIVRLPLEQQQQPRVYAQRWIQLAYLSLLALFSDWICFSVAAAPETYETVYAHHSAASIIDLFLFTNVASCFLVTNIVKKIGLQSAIRGAAVLMTVGCWMRSGVAFLPFVDIDTATLVSYPCLVGGTLLVGAAQPFFQCTPPLLSATWFAPSERATATAIALNFNQIGIATAFLVGGAMATTPVGLGQYFGVIAVLCTIVAGGTLLQFQNEPAIPPSASEMEKKKRQQEPDHTEPSFVESAQRLFQTNGFTPALVAFVCSIAITNIVGTFIEEILHRGGVDNQGAIDLAGAGFELAILVGGIVIGGYVDHTKHYKQVTLACLTVTAMAVIPLGWTFASGQATAAAMPHAWAPLVVVGALMVRGDSYTREDLSPCLDTKLRSAKHWRAKVRLRCISCQLTRISSFANVLFLNCRCWDWRPVQCNPSMRNSQLM